MIRYLETYYHMRVNSTASCVIGGRVWLLLYFASGDVGVVGIDHGACYPRIVAPSREEALDWIREDCEL